MSDYHTPEETPLPDPTELPEPRTPPLGDPDDEGPGGVPERPPRPEEPGVELPGEKQPDEDR